MSGRELEDNCVRTRIEAWLRNDKSVVRAAEELGINTKTLGSTIYSAEGRRVAAELTQDFGAPVPDLAPREAPKYRKIGPPDGVVRVMVIGDAHDDPRIPDKSRFALMGAHAEATRPDVILSIGDFIDFASLSTHEREDTYKARGKPSFMEDMASAVDALQVFEAQLSPDYHPRKHITFGNHEERCERAEDIDPKARGMYVGQRDTLFESHGWTHQAYRHWTVIGGVGFTHAPQSIMGKPLGGKNVENTVANDTTFSVVFGHTHRYNYVRRPKQGYANSVTVVNVGCAMPHNYVPSYASALPSGFSYGVVDMMIEGGEILSAPLRTFRELTRMYGEPRDA